MLKRLKHCILHHEQTETYRKTYFCGIRIKKKKDLRKYYDNKFQKMTNILHGNQSELILLIKELEKKYINIKDGIAETQQQQTILQNQCSALQELCDNASQKQTQQLAEVTAEIKMQLNNIMLQNQENITAVRALGYNMANYYKELNFADLLHDTIIQSSWLKNKTFSLFGGAANYSFIYSLYRILDKVNPVNILEMGLGQTTHLTSQYVAYKNPSAHLSVCEHNADWINIYKQELPNIENFVIKHFDLEYFEYDNLQNDKYAGLLEFAGQQKFDLIVVDGPIGYGKNLPRSNILDLINNDNLAANFVIIFDDAERTGEQTTIAHAESLLHNKGVEFVSFARNGIKRQYIITSPTCDFVRYL